MMEDKYKDPEFVKWRKMYDTMVRVIPEMSKLTDRIAIKNSVSEATNCISRETGLELYCLLDSVKDFIEGKCPDCTPTCLCVSSHVSSFEDIIKIADTNNLICDERKDRYMVFLNRLRNNLEEIDEFMETYLLSEKDTNRLHDLNVLHEYGIQHLNLKRKLIDEGKFVEEDFDITRPEKKTK